MKKTLWLILILVLSSIIALSACNKKPNTPSNDFQQETENLNNSNTSCNHSYGLWKDIEKADCLNGGEQIRVCTKCSHSESKTVSALGHTTSDGTCSRCNQYIGNWTKEKVQDIIQIHDIYVDDIDSAEGVDMRISWTNTSDKTIKYIYFYVEPYNAVGDKVYCEIRDYSRFTARVTGPCESGHKGYYTVGDESIGDIYYYGDLWEKCWYNGSVDSIKLLGVKIVYMDESVIELNESAASMAFAQYPNYSNKKALYHKEMVDYYAEGNCQIFALSMYNMAWISFAEKVDVDIEIVNSAGVKVYSSGYIVRENNFFTSDYFGAEALTWGLIIENSEITKGTRSTGTLYFRVYNDDLSIDFSGELSVANLPT